METKDFPSVKAAKRLAEYQLRYYLEMMKEKEKDENHNQREATSQSLSRILPTA